MRNKITILTGAGFTVTPDFGNPSTKLLTDKLRELEIEKYDINGKKPGQYFYEKLCNHYTRRNSIDDLSVVNFETIIHFVEELYSQLTSYNKIRENTEENIDVKKLAKIVKLSKVKGVNPAFVEIKRYILRDLELLKAQTNTDNLYKIVKRIYSYFINAIIDEVKPLGLNSKNIGMRKFTDDFLTKFLPRSNFTRRLYTMNYDTWLNKYGGIYDGFDRDGNFESEKVMEQFDIDCHYNLHGSIFWKNDSDANNIKKIKIPVIYKNDSQSSNYGINREPLLATPIITGYNKLERMKFTPYLQFYYALQTDILKSDLLLIIGYSFSDIHINNIISLYKGKCVVVDYIGNLVDKDSKKKSFKITESANSKFESVKPNNGGFKTITKEDIDNGWTKSQNHKTRFWWRGIGDDFYNNWRNIIS